MDKNGLQSNRSPLRSMYMLIELGRLWVLAHHLAWGGGKPVDCSYVAHAIRTLSCSYIAHAIRTLSINHDIWAQALKIGVFGLKSF